MAHNRLATVDHRRIGALRVTHIIGTADVVVCRWDAETARYNISEAWEPIDVFRLRRGETFDTFVRTLSTKIDDGEY